MISVTGRMEKSVTSPSRRCSLQAKMWHPDLHAARDDMRADPSSSWNGQIREDGSTESAFDDQKVDMARARYPLRKSRPETFMKPTITQPNPHWRDRK
jgi:hypothetical protein